MKKFTVMLFASLLGIVSTTCADYERDMTDKITRLIDQVRKERTRLDKLESKLLTMNNQTSGTDDFIM